MEKKKSKFYNTARWQRLRVLALSKSAFCMYCFREYAKVVDHLSGTPTDNRVDNLIPCCAPCHNKKSMRVDAICRLVNVHTLNDFYIYAARKLNHEFVLDERVIHSLPDKLKFLYTFITENSMVKPENPEIFSQLNDLGITADDYRYLIVLMELARTIINRSRKHFTTQGGDKWKPTQ